MKSFGTIPVAGAVRAAMIVLFATAASWASEPVEEVRRERFSVDWIDQQIRQAWSDNEVKPSEVATDYEWIRRVYLDIVGHIPRAGEVERFVRDRNEEKRSALIDELLDDTDYVRHFATIWTNLSIGRGTPRRVNRDALQKFYREVFGRDRSWNEVVVDVVTGEGHFEENGEVNYLLAQMANRDDGVQLTAKTARLFLGMQVQCTQCHDHPFNDWKQGQFWQFNSFFKQMRKVDHRKYDPNSGRQIDDYSEVVWKNFEGPVYFEKRSGLMQVAYPEYFGRKVNPDGYTNRREELGKLLADESEETPQLAKSYVNRMWGHFFGYGFTRPVDDMGPHNPASHPELLERLSAEFAKSGYNTRQLIRWICNSEAYGLSSRFGRSNELDNPAAGEMPLFSHMYVKSMQAEQLYDSLIVATNAHTTGGSNWEQAERKRKDWMRQFVVAFDNDENGETTTFDGTIPQALMMMNSELINNAISTKNGSYLKSVINRGKSDKQRIQQLYLTALSRLPSRTEMSMASRLASSYGRTKPGAGYQDVFWALLNSNEFVFIH